ncbi:MAG: putative selenoprotein [Magnetococcales bacterium]|nr:putative selenoprotein [Magnetococcales bacterium]MBF0322683.1 putative selenoprotein [Magnetococcales bacterium]
MRGVGDFWRRGWGVLAQAARLLVGLPDYDAYVLHRQRRHPGEPVMTRAAFIQERQEARYGGRGGQPGRCC